jgi:hypothetical protein
MSRLHNLLIGLSAVAFAGSALAQPAQPDQGAAPPSSNPNMGDGTGAGPAGSIGDPNGSGPGSAAPAPDPGSRIVDQPVSNAPPLSKNDMLVLKSCHAMPRDRMSGVAKCRSLMTKSPDLFN